ncbi:PiggyBac transposase uribo1 [Plakobranchus ocellatus]|uniref:PiggyBac transposase uribo1 n=1 Tax=Plakobranchus ocellatus TaxID=259542 RepID=A0AAV4B8R0_9GAST|nr:PiggyBac transposase uribo1 [Plakobranchus ocellatus]
MEFMTVCDMTRDFPSQGLAMRLDNLSWSVTKHHSQLEALALTKKGLSDLRMVVQQLASLTTAECPTVASAAALCLGAIGPINLQVLSLSRQSGKIGQALELYKGQENEKYCWLFHALDASLMDESLEAVATASSVLQKVLVTKASKQFERHFTKITKGQNSLFYHLQLFKSSGPNNPTRNDPNRDKFFKIRPPVDHLNTRFPAVNYFEQQLLIDESMMLFRGLVEFHQNLLSKPIRYGLKLYLCCESSSGYVLLMKFYTGANTTGP